MYIGIVAVFEYTEDNIAIPTLVLDGNGILGVREIFFSGSVATEMIWNRIQDLRSIVFSSAQRLGEHTSVPPYVTGTSLVGFTLDRLPSFPPGL